MQSTISQAIFLLPLTVFCLLATYNFVVYRKITPRKRAASLNPQGVSLYVPVFNDQQIVQSLPYLAKLDYPTYQVKILDDSTDPKLISAIDKFVSKHNNFSVIRRTDRTGFKGGAIENALKNEEQPLICLLDCDFRPTTDFLKQIVSSIEAEKADVIQGYPRHVRGGRSLLGIFYRACQAGSIICLFGRNRLNLAPILYGSCFLMKTQTAQKVGFDSGSITEDINFCIRAYAAGNFKVAVCPDVYADGGCPATFRDYITQQLRWCEGTIRDVFTVNFKTVLRIKSVRKRLDLLINGLHYSSGFFLLWMIVALLFEAINPVVGLFVTVYTTLGFAYPLMLGASLEKYNWKMKIKTLLFGSVLVYVMCPFMTYGFLKGLTTKKATFKVTHKL